MAETTKLKTWKDHNNWLSQRSASRQIWNRKTSSYARKLIGCSTKISICSSRWTATAKWRIGKCSNLEAARATRQTQKPRPISPQSRSSSTPRSQSLGRSWIQQCPAQAARCRSCRNEHERERERRRSISLILFITPSFLWMAIGPLLFKRKLKELPKILELDISDRSAAKDRQRGGRLSQ